MKVIHDKQKMLELQRECCENYGSAFLPSETNQLVVVSDGVLEGITHIEGVRYPSPIHMTGWWLTTDEYDGNIDSLKNIHYKHIMAKLPKVAMYLALSYGYRFLLLGEDEHVWFDEKVSSEK